MKDSEIILRRLLDMGQTMLSKGAGVRRVEDTLQRMGLALGASEMHVFAISSSLLVTMKLPDGSAFTQSRRINRPDDTDFFCIEELNALSRKCCAGQLSFEDLDASLEQIMSRRTSSKKILAGSMLAAGSLCVFFGGSLADGIFAALTGALIVVMQIYFSPLASSRMIFNLVSSFVSGTVICLLCQFIDILHPDKIMIGDIMLLIPGIALTNAIRDVMTGDTISGIMKLVESLLWAGALACGFMTAMYITGVHSI